MQQQSAPTKVLEVHDVVHHGLVYCPKQLRYQRILVVLDRLHDLRVKRCHFLIQMKTKAQLRSVGKKEGETEDYLIKCTRFLFPDRPPTMDCLQFNDRLDVVLSHLFLMYGSKNDAQFRWRTTKQRMWGFFLPLC